MEEKIATNTTLATVSSDSPIHPGEKDKEFKMVSSDDESFAQRLQDYITKCLPQIVDSDDEEGSGIGMRSWTQQLQAAQSAMLPSLKFHDLVFGRELGLGAFGTVKYARHMQRNRPQASWPEYAVKIVPAERIAEHKYTANIEREIAILRLVTHPGIARLVSSFR